MNLHKINNRYIADLLPRMGSKEMLPQTGDARSSVDSVSWQAFREAERLGDASVMPQIEELFLEARRPDELVNLLFILASLITNTRSQDAISLFLRVAEAVPNTPIEVHYVISHARKARVSECRDYVLRQLDTKHGLVLGEVIQFLGELGRQRDISTIGELLDSDCRGLGCGLTALGAGNLGHRDGLPYLVRAVERHLKARKNVDKDTLNSAIDAIKRITGNGTTSEGIG